MSAPVCQHSIVRPASPTSQPRCVGARTVRGKLSTVNSSVPDHYDTLEVAPNATDAEIKRRYRKLMREVHPDANANDPLATRKAARINAAYETLGDPAKRRAYDDVHHPRARSIIGGAGGRGHYEHLSEQPNWEDIVAASVPARRRKHIHSVEPLIEPEEIEVDMADLRSQPRVRRHIRITNRCECTMTGDVSTSEPWVWGPVGHLRAGPGETVEFDIEIVARKVTFPGISRVIFVSKEWTGVIPVKITGYQAKSRRVYPATNAAYVPNRRRRAVRR